MPREVAPPFDRPGCGYRLLRASALLCGLVALALASGYVAMQLTLEEDRMAVPRVIGLDATAASAMVREAGLTPRVVAEEFSATIPKGHVTAQRPSRGTRLKIGSEVRLFLSRGSDQLAVPNLAGMTLDQARRTLAEVGLSLGPLSQIHSDAHPRDAIVAHDPPPDAPAVRGGTVRVLVSLGPLEETIAMPDLRGREMVVALNLLKELQLEAHISFTQAASRQGSVVGQDPAPGAPVRVGGRVQVTVGE
jgi:serine/threonine-protein kinase